MKPSCLNQWVTTYHRPGGADRGFTRTELLVVIGLTALLATVLLSASFTTQDRVLRAECASNLKQIGSATLIYAGENNDFVPLRSWKNCPPQSIPGNPWQTYEACRILGIGSRVITEGPYGLGLLFFDKAVADPKAFYCPSVKGGAWAYNSYSEPDWPWPSIPADFDSLAPGALPYVRCSYNYYPQPKATEIVNTGFGTGSQSLPVLTAQLMTFTSPNPGDPVQGAILEPAPLKTADMDPTKAASCDVLSSFNGLSHKLADQPGGVNVLFGDGHVKWVPVRGNDRKGSLQPFDPKLWDQLSGTLVGNNPNTFRIIMNSWMP